MLTDETVRIPLAKGGFALVDAEDYERLIVWEYRPGLIFEGRICDRAWFLQHRDDSKLYVLGNISVAGKLRQIRLHRMVMAAPAEMLVDHKGPDTLDNRRENLRIATPSQNNFSRRNETYPGKFRGVLNRNGRYLARIKAHGTVHSLGTFANEADAAAAYNVKALELFGEFARINELPILVPCRGEVG